MRRADIEVPNLAVAMNAWARLACYPRGNFYPINNRTSTCYEKVTKPYFRNCLTCRSRSKATLCLYTLLLVSIQDEVTFGILRYSLVRDRPSQTTHQTLFWLPDSWLQSVAKLSKGSVTLMTPLQLASKFQSLLPTLYNKSFTTMSSCSKDPGVFLS